MPCLPLVSLGPSFSQDAGEDDSQMDVAAEVPTSREDTHTHAHDVNQTYPHDPRETTSNSILAHQDQ